MLIFAHRGLKLEHPENTMPAFAAALEAGFGIELDVRLTKDRQLICLHNPDTEHVTGTKLTVRESTYEELSRLDVLKPGVKIPRFPDVAEQIMARFGPTQKAAIHVKGDEQGEQQIRILLEAFRRCGLHEKALLFDLTFETAERVRKADPSVEIAISVGEKNYAPTIYTWGEARQHLNLFHTVWWDEWKIPASEYTEQRAREIQRAGKKIYAISPELHADHGHSHALQGYEKDWRNFITWKIDGVCTAHPRDLDDLLGLL
ncbi:MAG: glycerophosphodiester phosphodiesterase family protein [bacterium]|nr:glycerophosphodiester phosphodiesterase family protein [bacterium]